MKRIAIACLGVAGLMFAGSAVANAGDVHVQIGGYGSGWYGGKGFNRVPPYSGFRYQNPKSWQHRYRYQPGIYVPHGNHLHYIPGHYQMQRGGHFDPWYGNQFHHHHH